MSNLVKHAERELALLSDGENDPMQDAMNKHLIGMVKLFAEEGHSGFSASYAVSALEKLLRFEPLKPLTGEADEWLEIQKGVFQNTRCSHVFKEGDRAYDTHGKVFVEPNGAAYTSRDSWVDVTFPYTPKTERVQVGARTNG